MSEPVRHHYVPQFLLRNWQDSEGRIAWLHLYGKEVVSHRTRPKNVAVVKGLYALDGVPAEFRNDLEKNFFGPIDAKAALVAARLIRGDKNLTEEDRTAWAQFAFSLRLRTPDAISSAREFGNRAIDELNREIQSERPDLMQGLGIRDIARQSDDRVFEMRAENFGITQVVDWMAEDSLIIPLATRPWVVVDVSKSNRSLVISDRPYFQNAGFGDPNWYAMLPLSPTKLWIAGASDDLSHLKRANLRDLAAEANRQSVRQAKRFVAGSVSGSFVTKHMGKAGSDAAVDFEQLLTETGHSQ